MHCSVRFLGPGESAHLLVAEVESQSPVNTDGQRFGQERRIRLFISFPSTGFEISQRFHLERGVTDGHH